MSSRRSSARSGATLGNEPRWRRDCPVCGAGPDLAEAFLEENIDAKRLTQSSFASRKLPEFMNWQLVRCLNCDLVYADTAPSQSELAEAYHAADYDSAIEAEDAADTYIAGLHPLLSRLAKKDCALEIGTGTGVFLERLLTAGFSNVIGVEPSSTAIAAAPEHRRRWIRHGIFEEATFEPASFDLVCCFMTMEHVRDPGVVAAAARRLLRPGGAFAAVVHDYRSLVNRWLGRHSPIIDVQHMQLFSRNSVARLFDAHGYREVAVQGFANRYPLAYWLRLAPLPVEAKTALQKGLRICGLDRCKLGLNVGNLMAWGVRPKAGDQFPND